MGTALQRNPGEGVYALDGYNNTVMWEGIVYAVTTRTFGDNNHFLLEVYENN